MKTLPSQKEKRRYVVFEAISEKKHGFNETKEAIMHGIRDFLGQKGAAKARARLISDRWDDEKQKGIIMAERKSISQIKAALCLTTSIAGNTAIIRSTATSGILKKAIAR